MTSNKPLFIIVGAVREPPLLIILSTNNHEKNFQFVLNLSNRLPLQLVLDALFGSVALSKHPSVQLRLVSRSLCFSMT